MEQIRIDLIPGGVAPNAHASQYDIGRVIRFKLYNGGSPYTLAGTETVTVDITKPDGVEETITLTNTSSDYVDFITENGLLNQAGLYECEFRITDGGDDIGTQNFNLRAEADAKGAIIIMEAQGNPANFETDLAGALVSCIVDISYNVNGYKSALVLNTSNTPTTNKTPYLYRPSYSNGYGYETLIGGTCGVNQLVYEPDVWTSDPKGFKAGVSFVTGHKLLMIVGGTANDSFKVYVFGNVGGTVSSFNSGIGSTIISCPFTFTQTVDGAHDTNNSTWIWIDQYASWSDGYINIIDLTAYFGTTIADYVYTLETGTSGAGITWLKNNGFFGADYYPYNAGGLLSVKTSKKINRDADNNIIGEYPLDDIELRGILKLDGSNNLYYDGDTYSSSGEVVRKYGIVDLGELNWNYNSADAYFYSPDISALAVPNSESFNSLGFPSYYDLPNNCIYVGYASNIYCGYQGITDVPTFISAVTGKYLLYELATPTTETADAFTNPMIVDGNGTEQFVDGRTVEMPVGHNTIYGEDMKARFTDFGVTVYGGEYNLTTGVLTSTKNADGTDKNPPETFQLTPVYIPVRNGDNYIADNTNGDAHVKYYKKA